MNERIKSNFNFCIQVYNAELVWNEDTFSFIKHHKLPKRHLSHDIPMKPHTVNTNAKQSIPQFNNVIAQMEAIEKPMFIRTNAKWTTPNAILNFQRHPCESAPNSLYMYRDRPV